VPLCGPVLASDMAYLLLVLFCCVVALLAIGWIAFAMGSPRFWAITVVALTYPIGKSLQALVMGPQWIRHYLSDFGFVPFMVLAWVLALRALQFRWGTTEIRTYWVVPATSFMLGISLLGEGVQWIMGTGDWVDAACEIVSALATVALLKDVRAMRWERLGW
jgi:hypothetical protein